MYKLLRQLIILAVLLLFLVAFSNVVERLRRSNLTADPADPAEPGTGQHHPATSLPAEQGRGNGLGGTPAPPEKDPRMDPGRAEYWVDDDVIKAAKATVRPTLEAMEKRNSKVLFETASPSGPTIGIALTAPSEADLGEVAAKMTQALASVPPERATEVREKLLSWSNKHTAYPGAFRLIQITRATDRWRIETTDLKDLSQAVPDERGVVTIQDHLGSSTPAQETTSPNGQVIDHAEAEAESLRHLFDFDRLRKQ